jgi:hypothetical protein
MRLIATWYAGGFMDQDRDNTEVEEAFGLIRPEFQDTMLYRYCWVPIVNRSELKEARLAKNLRLTTSTKTLQSWTDKRDTAQDFARISGRPRGNGLEAALVGAKIPGKCIIASYNSVAEAFARLYESAKGTSDLNREVGWLDAVKQSMYSSRSRLNFQYEYIVKLPGAVVDVTHLELEEKSRKGKEQWDIPFEPKLVFAASLLQKEYLRK